MNPSTEFCEPDSVPLNSPFSEKVTLVIPGIELRANVRFLTSGSI